VHHKDLRLPRGHNEATFRVARLIAFEDEEWGMARIGLSHAGGRRQTSKSAWVHLIWGNFFADYLLTAEMGMALAGPLEARRILDDNRLIQFVLCRSGPVGRPPGERAEAKLGPARAAGSDRPTVVNYDECADSLVARRLRLCHGP